MESEINIPTTIDEESNYVRDGDLIQIETVNHSYKFAVKSRDARRGLLTGGALGEREFTATLSSSLQAGSGATFRVWLDGSLYRLLTSDITTLIRIRSGERASEPIMRFPSLSSDTGSLRQ